MAECGRGGGAGDDAFTEDTVELKGATKAAGADGVKCCLLLSASSLGLQHRLIRISTVNLWALLCLRSRSWIAIVT
jgi:hypothetical protein